MIGVDTSFIIDFLKQNNSAVKFMEKNKEQICSCEIVNFEFLCGNLTEKQREIFFSFISRFHSFLFNRSAMIESSNIYRRGKKKGKTIAKPDSMIAGIYKSNGITKIITSDSKHFKQIKGLKVISY